MNLKELVRNRVEVLLAKEFYCNLNQLNGTVCVAKDHNRVIGVAGAAGSSIDDLWEMGVDVIEEYRNAKLGTYLVRRLTKELLSRNIVPFYSASVTNIGSQMVAYRCGYRPCWVDTYGTVLDGSSVYNDLYHFKGK